MFSMLQHKTCVVLSRKLSSFSCYFASLTFARMFILECSKAWETRRTVDNTA